LPYQQPKIDNALKRAKKMEKLFKKKYFDPIMDALVPIKNENAFRTACKTAGLAQEDEDWLWNYLQHIDGNYWGPAKEADDYPAGWEDAASTGW
jgi:hypothetical protein